MPSVWLESREGDLFEVALDITTYSKVLRKLQVGSRNEDVHIFKIEGVSTNILKKVVLWCDHHKNLGDYLPEDELGGVGYLVEIPVWDEDFFARLDEDSMVDLAIAAEVLDMEVLRAMIHCFYFGDW